MSHTFLCPSLPHLSLVPHLPCSRSRSPIPADTGLSHSFSALRTQQGSPRPSPSRRSGLTHPRPILSLAPSVAHGAYNFHIVPSLSRAAVGQRASRRLSRACGGVDEGERRPLKSSWEPITRVTQGRTHRAARHRKILLRPRALRDRLKPRIMIVGARNALRRNRAVFGDWVL